MNVSSDSDSAQYLTFMLDAEVFGIGILSIREIIDYGAVTKVPMMPDSIRGVINLRGAVVPIMDLRARFGRGPTTTGRRSCVVIVEASAAGDRSVMGVLVDAVNAVVDIPAAQVEPAPGFGVGVRPDFIHGMGKLGDRFVVLLDVERTLSTADVLTAAAA